MLSFKQHEDKSLHEVNLFRWIADKFRLIKKSILSLRLGASKRVSFNFGTVSEAGAWKSTVMGVYAEKWAVWSFMNEMKTNKFSIEGNPEQSKKEAEAYGKLIRKAARDGVSWKGAKLKQSEIDTTPEELPGYKEKGIAMGKRAFLENVVEDADSRYCHYRVEHVGGTEALNSTADMIITKFTEKEMKEELKFSLKAYLSSGEKTRGTQKDPFGILGAMIGIKNTKATSVEKHKEKFEKAFGGEVLVLAKKSRDLQDYYASELKSLKSKGDKQAVNKAKLLIAKKYGGEIIDIQIGYWQKCFEVAAKTNPAKFAEVVLELLDMRPDSPVLLTSGMDKKGQITTFKNYSPEIQKLMSANPKDVEVRIEGQTRAPKAHLAQYVKKPQVFGSNMQIAFYLEGVELYRVGSQVWTNGTAQFSAKAGNMKTSVNLTASISEAIGLQKDTKFDNKASILAAKAAAKKSKPIPQKDMDVTFPPAKMRKHRVALQEIKKYSSREGLDITKLSKKQAIDVLDMVANQKLTPEQALIDYEDKLL